ncbi:MAG: hypothetical protein COB69_00640 [Phycisphaera sp.]|nr:MAG: hypothetical protein COB69_00640 [Phycisphaera sp.]
MNKNTHQSTENKPMSRTFRIISSTLAISAASAAHAQDLGHKAPPQSTPIAITNVTIHPMTSPTIEHGFILFNEGIIAEVGAGDRVFAANTRVIDAEGLHVYPGMIAPFTQLGLTEINALRQTKDMNEVGSVTPEVRACVAVNPDSTLIPVTRSNGILTFASFPTGGAIPGRVSIMAADGWTWQDMAIEEDAGLAINWPSMRPSNNWWADEPDAKQLERIKERLQEIDEIFQQAISYRDAGQQPRDVRLEAMLGVLPGPDGSDPANPVFISANDIDQINAAVTWATALGLRTVIVGGNDAPLAAELLTLHGIPIIISGTQRFPKRNDSPHDDAYTLPIELTNLGIRWCMASTDRTAHERNLPYNIAKSVAFGLDHEAGMRAITIDTAAILEIDDRIGSLEAHKDATIIITNGSPLEMTTNPVMAFIQGKEINLDNKQSELAEKYREKYRQLGLTRDN